MIAIQVNLGAIQAILGAILLARALTILTRLMRLTKNGGLSVIPKRTHFARLSERPRYRLRSGFSRNAENDMVKHEDFT